MARQQNVAQTQPIKIWQWNCRSFRRKRGNIAQFIHAQTHTPDILALQETYIEPKLTGYNTFAYKEHHNGPIKTATLVSKRLTAIDHTLSSERIPHVLIEIIPVDRKEPSFFVLNIYSAPKERADCFDGLFKHALKEAKQRLLIVGDFNAAHPTWGYKTANPKGRRLALTIAQLGFTILTDAVHTTRIGNSVCRDTCPDLTLIKDIRYQGGHNLDETLGSDHNII